MNKLNLSEKQEAIKAIDNSIKALSELLDVYINKLKDFEKISNDHKKNEKVIKDFKIYILVIAGQIDANICFKNVLSYNCMYEGLFFRNIGFMKMQECVKKLLNLTKGSNNSEIQKNLNEWNDRYLEKLNKIRINSGAHYDLDMYKFYEIGFEKNDAFFNSDVFTDFFVLLSSISDLLDYEFPLIQKNTSHSP